MGAINQGIPKEVLFARSIRRSVRRLDHVISEENIVGELLVRKLWHLTDEQLKILKQNCPEVSQFVDVFIEVHEKIVSQNSEAKK
jgi:hypothetical protein